MPNHQFMENTQMDIHVSMLNPWTVDVLRVTGFFGMDIVMDIAWILELGYPISRIRADLKMDIK